MSERSTTAQAFSLDEQQSYFDGLFADSDDPWGFRTRWYEARKRALTLASLPAARYESAFEPGCANGELSFELAARCDKLLVSDGAPAAVATARERLAPLQHVQVLQAWLPQQWPQGAFDLVVVSELAYYLDAATFEAFVARMRASLQPGGTVLACHWRRPIAGCMFDGDTVHRAMHAALGLPRLGTTIDADFRLDVWQDDARSIAQREGLA